MTSNPAAPAAHRARTSRPFRIAARAGFAMNGILFIVIGVIAIGIGGAGGSGETADQSGALQGIAAAPGGMILIWAIAIGLLALGLWQLLDGVLADDADAKDRWASRAKSIGKGIAYLVIGGSAIGVALGGGSGGSGSSGGAEESVTAGLLATPGGVVLVVAIGLGVLGVAAYLVVKGAKQKFLDDLEPVHGSVQRGVVLTGTIGYIARGVAFAIVGVLFIVAGVTADAEQAGGLDAALATLASLPFGRVLLVAVGVGFIASGVYGIVRAKYAKL
jgi:hypothetical protein